MVLKFISKYFGKFLVSVSISFFIFSFFMIYLADNTEAFKASFTADKIINVMVETDGLSLEEIKTICAKNPNQESCDIINNPSKLLDEQFSPFTEKIASFRSLAVKAIPLAIIVLILGFIFIYLGTSSFAIATYLTSLTISIASLFSILFYKLMVFSLPDLATNIQNTQQDVPQELLNLAIQSITEWIRVPIQKTVFLCLILLLIFVPLAIFFYIKKRNISKKQAEQDH